jgi:hypothetical protein
MAPSSRTRSRDLQVVQMMANRSMREAGERGYFRKLLANKAT